MNMMHVISIPYALMKVNPLSWIQKVCQFKGNTHSCFHHSEAGLVPLTDVNIPVVTKSFFFST